jgi:hypothetical protein
MAVTLVWLVIALVFVDPTQLVSRVKPVAHREARVPPELAHVSGVGHCCVAPVSGSNSG